MSNQTKTNAELIEEISRLNQRIRELELSDSERKLMEQTLRESETWHRILFEVINDAVFVHELDGEGLPGRFLQVNDVACRRLGYTREELLSLSPRDITIPEEYERIADKRNGLASQGNILTETIHVTKDGRRIPVESNIRKFQYFDRQVALSISRDISDRKRMEEVLRESESRFRTLFESANDAICLMDHNVFIDCNPKTLEMFCSTREQIIGQPPFRFSPEVQPDGMSSMEKAREKINAAIKGHGQFFEWKHSRYDGTLFDAEVSLNAFSAAGKYCLQAIVRDVTDRKRAEEARQDSELKYRTLVELTHDFVFMVDRKGLFTYVNPNFEKATGYSLSDLQGHPFTMVIAPDERETIIDRFRKGVSGAPAIPYETELLDKEGKRFAVEFLASNLCDTRGNVTGRFGVGRDITKRKEVEALLKESEKRYRELSIIDDLTQLYNSRYFYNQLKREIDRVTRYEEQPLTLLLLDLDDFKQFNDAYGHVEGDHVLSRLGQVVKRCLRQTDSAYRYGGEEFTILLPMTTSKDAAVTAERIRAEFKKENFSPLSGQDVHLTMSIGLGQYKPQEDMKGFVHRIDQLMYQAKINGKDRVYSEL